MISVQGIKSAGGVSYRCPFCFTNRQKTKVYATNYYKNGRFANRPSGIHTHGSAGHKISHCLISNEDVLIIPP